MAAEDERPVSQTAGTAAGAVLGKAGYGAPSTMEPSTPPSSAITKTVPGGIDAVPQYEGQQFGSGKTTVPPATASAGQLEESEVRLHSCLEQPFLY